MRHSPNCWTPLRPSWQAGAPHGPGRLVPDVAADADPNTGYEIILYGDPTVVGGTSAVAPLYAGLFASFGTKLGFVTPELYLNSACFTDITLGDNGAFRARTGVDPCTGLGSPLGEILEERIQPAAIHASRVRALLTENAQLRASAAQAQQSPCSYCQQAAAAHARPGALLMPRAASHPYYYCAQNENGVWWKFPCDPTTGARTGPAVPAGQGECP